jgi:hypothetical protein
MISPRFSCIVQRSPGVTEEEMTWITYADGAGEHATARPKRGRARRRTDDVNRGGSSRLAFIAAQAAESLPDRLKVSKMRTCTTSFAR